MGVLKKLGIVKTDNQSSKMFESLFDVPFYDLDTDLKPHEYVNKYWSQFKQQYPKTSAAINGCVFELIIRTLFIRMGFVPLYIQAKVAFVPNVNFDAILYSQKQIPYSFSLKTSLRERYKQADLEGIALKYVHRKAKSFLLTLNKEEAKSVKGKIAKGDVIGLDQAILCSTTELDKMINELKKETFVEAGEVEIIKSSTMVTKNKIIGIMNSK